MSIIFCVLLGFGPPGGDGTRQTVLLCAIVCNSVQSIVIYCNNKITKNYI